MALLPLMFGIASFSICLGLFNINENLKRIANAMEKQNDKESS